MHAGASLGRAGAIQHRRRHAAAAGPPTATRFALYWEDESGATSAHTFWDLQREANRLSNVLASLGVRRGDAVALILPQRRETAVAHIAVYQMGAIAVPLSFLFGPDALEYRLADSAAMVALVDPQSLPNLAPIRARFPRLAHVVGVAGARGEDIVDYDAMVAAASPALRRGGHRRRRSGADRLYQRHHRPAQGRADAARLPARQPAGLHPFARRLSAAGRPVLVAGGLGVDRRPHGRAAAHALFRPADRRLPRPLRSGASVSPDREVPGAQHLPVPDGAEADDEGAIRVRASASTSTCAAS